MSRRFDDIVKRTPGGSGKAKNRIPKIEKVLPEPDDNRDQAPKVTRNSRYMLWSVAAVSIAFLLLSFSFLFGSAKVLIYPKIEPVALSDTFYAAAEPVPAGLTFELVVLSGEKEGKLEATEERELRERARGTAVIFNSYSSAPQRLAVDTRLMGSNGKLYKTSTPVTVPGMKANGTPGSVEVGIYAAEPGAEYNSGPIDFAIVGFQGTPKYEKFKVRSKAGTEIAGGFIGKTLIAAEAEKQRVRSALEAGLKEELYRKAAGQIPEGFVLFENATMFTLDKAEFPPGTEDLKVKLTGTLFGILFDKEALSEKIAEKKVAGYEKGEAFASNIGDLDFALVAPVGSFADLENITFKLSGTVNIVSRVDAEQFAADILGLPKKEFTSLLGEYENIDRVELTLSPIWKRAVPEEPEKVEVIVAYPEK